MSEKQPADGGENLPSDFPGKVRWIDSRVNDFLEQAMAGDTAITSEYEGGAIAPVLAAVFSEQLQKVVEIRDPENPIPERWRTTRIFPYTKDGEQFKRAGGLRKADQPIASWRIPLSGVAVDSLQSIFGNTHADHEQAADSLMAVLNASDAETVPYRDVFPVPSDAS